MPVKHFSLLLICLLMSGGALAQNETQVALLYNTSPSDSEEVLAMLADFEAGFEAENPGVDVLIETVDTTEIVARLDALIAAGTPPDLVKMPSQFVPSLVVQGAIEPLDGFITRDFAQRFVPSIINEGVQYQGRPFGLPWGVGDRALVYNASILEEAGVAATPTPWDELLLACEAIKAIGKACFGLQGGGGLETDVYFYYFVWANGGEIYNDSLSRSALNRPEAVDALAFIQSLIAAGYTQANPASADYERRAGVEALFAQGEVAMMISGAWLAVLLPSQAPDLKFAFAPIPNNGTPATYGVVDAMMMTSYSANKDLAWQFMGYMWRDENRVRVANFGSIPDLKAIGEQTIFGQLPALQTFIDVLPDARFIPLNEKSSAIAELVSQTLRDAYQNASDPSETLNALAASIDALIEGLSIGW